MSRFAEMTSSQSTAFQRATESVVDMPRPSAGPRISEPRSLIAYTPSDSVSRQSGPGFGVTVETIELTQFTPFEYRFRAPRHLLIAAELAEREDGETLVEGLPRSTLRNFTHRLTFVPAGHEFYGSQQPRALTRTVCLYIDPAGPLTDPALRFSEIEFKPRLFFHDQNLWGTALKLKSLVENPGSMLRQYSEALEMVLTHELARINCDTVTDKLGAHGGLACWQLKRAADYIEEHLADNIPLATLAGLVRLSPYHFCRSFKQSFGIPPHKYQAARRIERAKQLLARRELSITAIAVALGYSETSTFSVAFHRLVGQTPSRYRRGLD
jgi:AraC family transcriptional regulator